MSKGLDHERWLEHRIGKILYGKGYKPSNRGNAMGRKIRKTIEMIDSNYLALKTSPDYHPQGRRATGEVASVESLAEEENDE